MHEVFKGELFLSVDLVPVIDEFLDKVFESRGVGVTICEAVALCPWLQLE